MPGDRSNEAAVNRVEKDRMIATLSQLKSEAMIQSKYIIIAPSILGLLHFLE